MAGYDPWMFADLLMLVGGVLAVFLSVVWLLRLYRRYGLAEPPEEIQGLDQALRNGEVHVDLAPFVFDRELNDRTTYTRELPNDDGRWDLTIELEGDTVVAFQARLIHKRSRWMNRTVQGWTKRPKIIQEDGCG